MTDVLAPLRSGGFTSTLWAQTEKIRKKIDQLPFLQQLESGELPQSAFDYYIQQDGLYLGKYAQALSLVAVNAPSREAAAFWFASANASVTAELDMHRDLGTANEAAPASPVTLGYSSYLVATALSEGYAVGAAAVLPCFWIYADVGWRMLGRLQESGGLKNHPFEKWISMYGDQRFMADTVAACGFVNQAAEGASESGRTRMLSAFMQASRYELMFWEQSLNRQQWPGG